MPGYRSILVPVHFARGGAALPLLAADSAEAVAQALDLASTDRCELTFAHAFAGREDPGASDDGQLPGVRQALEGLVADAAGRGIAARWELLFGSPAAEVCSLAAAEDFDLVLVGTRREPGEGGALVGSTAVRITETCEVPVWIARRRDGDLRTVVVATDLSDSGEVVLRHGTRLARRLGADLHVVNACASATATDERSVVQDLRVRRARLEAQMAAAVRRGPVPAFQSHVELGSPEAVIWSVAREHDARVVVVGLREHAPHELLLRNHTAEEVLVDLPCSLLTIPL